MTSTERQTPRGLKRHDVASVVGGSGVPVCPNPIFVIGSPRSGTSVLAWSLAQHSDMWTSAESDFLWHLFGQDRFDESFATTMARTDGSWLSKNDVDRQELLSYLGLGFNALFTSRSEGKRWIDQSPTYTLIADLLADLFPGAFFVHILRDGRSVVNSMVSSGFSMHWADSFEEACKAWSHFVEVAMQFCERLPERGLTVRMDRLSADPNEEFGRLLAWLGAAPEAGPADFFSSNRINSSYGKSERQTRDGEGVWRAWSSEQRRLFKAHAAPTLLRYGLADERELDLALVG